MCALNVEKIENKPRAFQLILATENYERENNVIEIKTKKKIKPK